jgi:LPXTG-site transpeptidase (sortase) family protein
MKVLGKILIGLGIIGALLIAGRALYYAPNDEVDLVALPLTIEPTATSTPTSSSTAVTLPSGEVRAPEGTVVSAIPSQEQPARLLIPKLNIDANVQHVGVTTTGNMAAPNNFTDVSWWKYGTVPGYQGSAVMAGHEDNAIALDGVFKHLEDLEEGDRIYSVDKVGRKVEFKVVDMEVYPYDKAPLERIFHDASSSYLVLITCAGDWLPEAKTNDHRLVVYAELVK